MHQKSWVPFSSRQFPLVPLIPCQFPSAPVSFRQFPRGFLSSQVCILRRCLNRLICSVTAEVWGWIALILSRWHRSSSNTQTHGVSSVIQPLSLHRRPGGELLTSPDRTNYIHWQIETWNPPLCVCVGVGGEMEMEKSFTYVFLCNTDFSTVLAAAC